MNQNPGSWEKVKAEQDDGIIDHYDLKSTPWRRRLKSEFPSDPYEEKGSYFPQGNSQSNGIIDLDQPNSSNKSPRQPRKENVGWARFTLRKIARNKAEGRTEPRDAEDKARSRRTLRKQKKKLKKKQLKAVQPKQQKQKKSLGKKSRASKKSKGAPLAVREPNEVVTDNLAMALVDEFHDDGRLLNEKWEEIESVLADMVTDRIMATPEGPIPSFDCSNVIRGHRVIRCDDGFSKVFLADCVSRIGDSWNGLRISLVHASEIPWRPTARIWLPKGQTDHNRIISCLRAQNLDVDMADWVILKGEQAIKTSQPFVVLINQRCLPQLEAADYKVRYGIRMAKIKVLLTEADELSGEDEESWKREEDLPCSSKSRRFSRE
ncbi:uncharacterized protein LOC108049056 [Drosophila rhopaloa]|uniref:Uncharacterized protein LOC108049056 n=1 Tax=Drosophila rhopaloa TaxID=1041015 RepID=A0A6P4F5J4_DRORH|nr:uncharacterized protein LOC108049056 [Drosophila rhopaloa]